MALPLDTGRRNVQREKDEPEPNGIGVEYVAHLDDGSGRQVIFYPNGEFWDEYDPYKRERDAGANL